MTSLRNAARGKPSIDEAMKTASEKLVYDPDSGELVWRDRFGSRTEKGKLAGSINAVGYRIIKICKRDLLAHRIAWFICHGNLPPIIDHIDGNKLNNSITNLRAADKSLNGANRGKQANNTSGFKGVKRRYRKWIAQIHINGKNIYLGSFDTPEAAAAAYDKAARVEYGEFAYTEGCFRTQDALRRAA